MNQPTKPLRVYLAACTGTPQDSPVVRAWREAADADVFGVHRLTGDPAQADLILFVDLHLSPDWRLRDLLSHELVRRFRDKVLVYDERDRPWCALPGLYVSMPARHSEARWQRPCAYYGAVKFTEDERTGTAPDLLYSFVGSRSDPVRRPILRLTHPRAVLEDSSGFVFYDRSDPVAFDQRKAHYRRTLLRSKFVLCPRGAGTSSIRLFETLAAGRVPVLISDQWMPPAGPDWNNISFRVRESEAAAVPLLLEAAEAQFPRMAQAAREAHASWFSPPVIFHRLVEACAGLINQRTSLHRPKRGLHYLNLQIHQAKHQFRGSIGRLLQASGLR